VVKIRNALDEISIALIFGEQKNVWPLVWTKGEIII